LFIDGIVLPQRHPGPQSEGRGIPSRRRRRRRRRRKRRSLKNWLLVPVMLVVTYVPWPGLVFLLADSGLYQDVVDEGCEVEHGGKRADKGEGQCADGGDAGSVGQRRGEEGGGAILVYI
jgi:hypothetical protein